MSSGAISRPVWRPDNLPPNVLATEDSRSKNRELEGEYMVVRLQMPWPLEG